MTLKWTLEFVLVTFQSQANNLAKTIFQGTVKGGRRQGRQKRRWEDNIREWTGQEFTKSKRKLVVELSMVPQRPLAVRGHVTWDEVKETVSHSLYSCAWRSQPRTGWQRTSCGRQGQLHTAWSDPLPESLPLCGTVAACHRWCHLTWFWRTRSEHKTCRRIWKTKSQLKYGVTLSHC